MNVRCSNASDGYSEVENDAAKVPVQVIGSLGGKLRVCS